MYLNEALFVLLLVCVFFCIKKNPLVVVGVDHGKLAQKTEVSGLTQTQCHDVVHTMGHVPIKPHHCHENNYACFSWTTPDFKITRRAK